MPRTALVVGGNGIVGRNLALHLASSGQWKVIVTSRSRLDYETTASYVRMDLTDSHAVARQAEALKDVTHVFFAAYAERPVLTEQTADNLLLLKNLVEGIEKIAPALERVTFIQGGKAYGAHLGRYKTPAKETDPRHMPPNFYYSQEDFLRERSNGKRWGWTAIRPDIVVGFAIGNPMNLANIIGVYASICRELNVAFRFPGPLDAYQALVNVTGADVLAKAMAWASLEERCKNEIFNVTNGDVFRWSHAWPKLAEYFGIELADPLTFSLTEQMADKGPLWASMVKKYGLAKYELKDLVQWPFGDFVFNVRADAFFDVNKARRYGFHEMHEDSVEQMIRTFKHLREVKIIP